MTDRAGAALSLVEVTKSYAVGGQTHLVAVNGLSLQAPPGATVALTGPSGSGKSTLLHLMGAMDRPDSGQILVDGIDIAALSGRQLSAFRRGVGFVFQRYNLLPALSALDNVMAPVLPYRTAFDKVARARELLDAVGLSDREKSLPSRLSGGEQQRVAIARALIAAPRLLLADEPTGNLDTRTGTEIVDLILSMREASPMTVVIATHDSGIAARLGRVVRLRDGAVIEDHDLDATPASASYLTGLG